MAPAVSQVSRSTRTRLADGSAIVIPNQMLVDGIVHNLSSGDTQA